ncbi:hypothetical protein PVK06_030647 [Gossypium arboreum]|uniref:Transposase MuDR plant domain-containing protein n=1 Tax=Gossypium arboreum TaxID=29729 RepID=A0ABR0NP40_GOSAR|nr:hypothetical protein PVK06_030647 [Gossypium arboreum]
MFLQQMQGGYRVVRNFVYCKGGVDFSKGLSVCYDNSSFIAMINHIGKRGFIHVYVEHEVDTPDVIDDTMLLPGNRERYVNISVGEPNCNEELNFNERVNGGAGETFTELGGESNVGSDFSWSRSYGSDSDGEVVCKRNRHVSFDLSNPIPHLELGIVFMGPDEFKIALAKYAIKKSFDIVYLRNEKGMTRAKCREDGCPFRIYVAIDNSDGFYKIKTFIETYKCFVTFNNKRASYKFVKEHFLSKIRVVPKLKLTKMLKLAKEELKVDLSRVHATRLGKRNWRK